jgi:hypothetical protein
MGEHRRVSRPITRLVKGAIWTATPCIDGCRSVVYQLYTTRLYRPVKECEGIEILMGATY